MLDAGPIVELAAAAERAGWQGFAFTEHPAPTATWLAAGGHQSLDPFVALSHVAAVTTELQLLTYVAVLPYRNPASLAKSAATVDKLSNGRLILGVGAGYLKAEFFALGVDFDGAQRPLRRSTRRAAPPLGQASRSTTRAPISRAVGPSGVPARCNSRSRFGSAATRRSPSAGWQNGPRDRMPLTGPAGIFPTVRSPPASSIDDIRSRLQRLKDLAGDRFTKLDITVAYSDPSVYDMTSDVERHRDAIGALRELGATWMVVPGPAAPHPHALEFLQAFAETYFP